MNNAHLADPLRADLTAFAVKWIAERFALVKARTSVPHPVAGRSALSTRIVARPKLALTRNVRILVPTSVELEPNVASSTTIQFANVHAATLAIPLFNVVLYQSVLESEIF